MPHRAHAEPARHPPERALLEAVFAPVRALPAAGHLLLYRPSAQVDVREQARALGFAGTAATEELWVPRGGRVVRARVGVLACSLAGALRTLSGLPAHVESSWRQPLGDSLRSWVLAAHLATAVVGAHRVAPTLIGDGAEVRGVWRALPEGDPELRAALTRLTRAMPAAAHALPLEDGMWSAAGLVRAFLDAVADLAVRAGTDPPRPGRPRARLLPWTARWAEALTDVDEPSVPLGEEAPDLIAAVDGWHRLAEVQSSPVPVELRLSPPADAAAPWELSAGVRAAGRFVPAGAVWTGAMPVDGIDAATVQETLMRDLGRAARLFPPLEQALRESAPTGVSLDRQSAWAFLEQAMPLLEEGGFVVTVPKGLEADQLRLVLRFDDEGEDSLDRDARFHWDVVVGDEALDEHDIERLLEQGSQLVRRDGTWMRIDLVRLGSLHPLRRSGALPLAQAVALGVGGHALLGDLPVGPGGDAAAGEEAEVVVEGQLGALLERLRSAAQGPPAPARPPGFVGSLRPYQQRGVAWLVGMGQLGLGAVLADDMGLGKSVQLIAYLLLRGGGPHLIVCPTSVVGNWHREIARFAPGLAVTVHHGSDRAETLHDPTGVVLTTYGTARRDAEALSRVAWDVVTLDEAQQIKNPATAAARAVRRLRRRQSVALTGTPLENRLSELWALMDTTNAGLLGSLAAFRRSFAAPIERRQDRAVARRLRRLIAPFILRREKSDPTVIPDLPAKIERTVVCPLTAEQAQLYEQAVERVFSGEALAGDGIGRRGRILALLTELKQICNHPAQGRERDGAPLAGRSGKLAVAREIVREAVDGEEQVLVFTQYVEMGKLLVTQLAHDLGTEVPFLHGGVPAGRRDRLVAAFQGEDRSGPPPPVLVVSLRAGGTGLNLTAATQVLHYDRWWNPAVEDQATDRTHRIGQERTVEVHKLVTAGTVEERVAELLERKRLLADRVVGAGEAWVTELGDRELRELVALSASPSTAEDDEDDWPDRSRAVLATSDA